MDEERDEGASEDILASSERGVVCRAGLQPGDLDVRPASSSSASGPSCANLPGAPSPGKTRAVPGLLCLWTGPFSTCTSAAWKSVLGLDTLSLTMFLPGYLSSGSLFLNRNMFAFASGVGGSRTWFRRSPSPVLCHGHWWRPLCPHTCF